jgi:hypothetical protein
VLMAVFAVAVPSFVRFRASQTVSG